MKKSALFLPGLLAALMIAGHGTPWARSEAQAGVTTSGRSTSLAPTAAETVFYLATNGRDSWSGKLAEPNARRTDGPFQTLQRAQKAVRALKARASLDKPVTVYMRQGRYDLSKPLVFMPADSGTPQDPITYAAYPGETPLMSGGKVITGWQRVRDRKLLAQAGGELWMARLPEVKEGKWYFHELFVNGQRKQRARTPGFFYIDGKVHQVRLLMDHRFGADIREGVSFVCIKICQVGNGLPNFIAVENLPRVERNSLRQLLFGHN